jgi:hypothetical protein
MLGKKGEVSFETTPFLDQLVALHIMAADFFYFLILQSLINMQDFHVSDGVEGLNRYASRS